MLTISFVIRGNPRDPTGHPLPKARLTKGQQWTDKARQYVDWKAHVAHSFLEAARFFNVDRQVQMSVLKTRKPIPFSKKKTTMTVMCHFWDDRRPDSENVFGSIADSLFANDKNLVGSHDFDVGGKKAGTVDVTVHLPDDIFGRPR